MDYYFVLLVDYYYICCPCLYHYGQHFSPASIFYVLYLKFLILTGYPSEIVSMMEDKCTTT